MELKKVTIGILVIILLLGGVLYLRSRSNSSEQQLRPEPSPTRSFEPISDEVDVEFEPNSARTQARLTVSNMQEAGVESLEYEILYETEGLIKGINSGSEPIMVDSSGTVEREVDFGTCSSGVCRYDKNIGEITLVIRFNTSSGPKIFKQEYS